jgi:Zn-dependent protease
VPADWIAQLNDAAQLVSTVLIPLIVAITVHEAAHGWAAERLGDDTARRLGRVTLNPIPHIDPIGTVLLPGLLLLAGSPFLIGFAKPVPVNFARLRDPRRGMIGVALAGPLSNILMAIAAALVWHPLAPIDGAAAGWLRENLQNFFFINIVLAVFNMLPLPPLDGGRVLTGLLPWRLFWRVARFERQGILILLTLVILVPLVSTELGHPINPLVWILEPGVAAVQDLLLWITGW